MENLYVVVFNTEEGNCYNGKALESVVITTAKNSEEAVKKSLNEMVLREMNIEDLWTVKETLIIKNDDELNKITKNKVNVFDERDRLKVGDKFKVNLHTCNDEDVLEWYQDLPSAVLTAKVVEYDVNGVWVEDCPFRIDLDEIVKLNLNEKVQGIIDKINNKIRINIDDLLDTVILISEVKKTGETNMMDRFNVIQIVHNMGFDFYADIIESNRDIYIDLLDLSYLI